MKIFYFFFLLPLVCRGANILVVVPLPIKSHTILFQTLIHSLAGRGHNVTYVSAFPQDKKIANLTEIVLPLKGDDALKKQNIDLFALRKQSTLKTLLNMPNYGIATCTDQLSSKEMQHLLKSNSTFDLVIVQALLTESIMAGLSYKYEAPLIAFTTFQPTFFHNYLVGNMAPTSYIPDPFTGFSQRMTFFERMHNFVLQTIASMNYHLWYLPLQEEIYHTYFGVGAPPLIEVLENTSLMFTNDHYSLTYPRPLVPNMIPIGGLHVAPPKPLPKDYEELLANAKDGAILFSMGSNLKSSNMPPEKIEAFLNAFSKLKELVIWKFEVDLPNTPANVIITSWTPQSDILAHKNVKLFITHGGLLSTTEAVVRGIPVLGIPVFGDQMMNMQLSANAGMGLFLDYDQLTADALYSAIREAIDNPKYRSAAKLRSAVLHNQPQTPLENALFWVHHVLQLKGAPQLRSVALELSWYQLYQVDVILVLLAVALIALLFVLRMVHFVLDTFAALLLFITAEDVKKNL